MAAKEKKALTANFPLYGSVRHFIRILDRVPYELFRNTRNAIREHGRDRQRAADWVDPDAWIPACLTGPHRALAYRLWQESEHGINPRFLLGLWNLCARHGLLRRDLRGIMTITDDGQAFMEDAECETVATIDAREGILDLLRILSQTGRAGFESILPAFTDYCLAQDDSLSAAAIKELLVTRLKNLTERGYLFHSAQEFALSKAGARYLQSHRRLLP